MAASHSQRALLGSGNWTRRALGTARIELAGHCPTMRRLGPTQPSRRLLGPRTTSEPQGGLEGLTSHFQPETQFVSRAATSRAISAGAWSGMANTELTLISQRMYVSSPDAVREALPSVRVGAHGRLSVATPGAFGGRYGG